MEDGPAKMSLNLSSMMIDSYCGKLELKVEDAVVTTMNVRTRTDMRVLSYQMDPLRYLNYSVIDVDDVTVNCGIGKLGENCC